MSKLRKPKAPAGRDPLLRSAAEAKLVRSSGTAPKLEKQTPPEIIHELQVHQVELEMQNEELKWARLALEQSRDRYLHLYDFAPVGYFTFTGRGQIVEVNLTGAALLGVPRARLIGRGLGSFVAAEDRGPWERHLASVLPSAAAAQGLGEKQSCELQLKREDGSTFHARLESVRLDRPEEGKPAGADGARLVIHTALSDITERTQAAQALQAAHDRLCNVLESITDAFFSLDREWRFTYVNQEAERIFGGPRETFVGHTIWEKFPPAVGSRFQREYERAVAGKQTVHFEEFYPPMGKWFAAHAYPSAAGLSVYFHDITERKRTEEALRESAEFARRVIESSKDCIKVLDLEGHLLSMSEGGRKLLEIDDLAPYLNQSWVDFWKGQDRAAALEALTAARHGDAGSFSGFCETAKGAPKWWEVIVSPIKDADGSIHRLLAVSRDITARKQAEKTLVTASEQRRLVLEAAGMGAWDYRFDAGEVYWDERCRNQWGIAQGEQIDYAAALAAIHPDDRAVVDEAVKQALAGTEGGAYHREFRVVWPDGSVHWIGSHGQVYFEGEGERRRAVRFIGANLEITERRRMEEAQEFLSHCGYRTSSEDFFQALARYLAQSLGMDFVCIDRLLGDGLAAQTEAMYCDGKFEDNVSYALKDTPCGEVVGQTICCFPKDVRHSFPKDAVLQEMRAESYVGTTLWSFDGRPIGLIAVIGRKPLATPRLAESLLKLVAVRAAGELERKRAEEALRKAEERLRLAVEAGKMGAWDHDLLTGRIIWSDRCKAIFGVSPETTPTAELFLSGVHPEDRPRLDQTLRETTDPKHSGAYEIEYRYLWLGGSLRWVRIHAQTIFEEAHERRRAVRRLGLAMDITERKQAEQALAENEAALQVANRKLAAANETLEARVRERTAELQQTNEQLRQEIEVRREAEQELTEAQLSYRTVAEFTHDWEYWESPEYVLRYCSPSCERITGYSAQEFMANPRLLQQIVHPEDAGIWRKHREELLTSPEPHLAQFRIRTKDGAVRWLEHACQPVLGEDGVFLGIRGSNRDITDRKEEELQTQQLREELAHVTRATTAGQLAASLAHELNQPLTAILCNAQTAQQLLATDPPNVAEVREALDDIAQDSERAGGVIRRLRALFNKTGHDRSALQLNDVIHETLDLLRSEFVFKGISTLVHLEPTLPQVLGNRIELQQVVLNLVVNAMEAMSECEPGQRQLQIATGCQESREIRVSIRDSGPGIRMQPISRVFEPFFTTKANGMGMGLAITASIVEAHEGSLRAANNPDRGATFHLTFPIHHGEHA